MTNGKLWQMTTRMPSWHADGKLITHVRCDSKHNTLSHGVALLSDMKLMRQVRT